MRNRTFEKDGAFWRKTPKGLLYRQCEAYVLESYDSDEKRLCRRAASKGDRLCSYHAERRDLVNRRNKFVITLSKKGDKPYTVGFRKVWPRYVIAKEFDSYEDAQLWADLNGTLIFRIPDVKSFCIERLR